VASPLFTGPSSLRDSRERVAFVLTLLFAFPAAALIGFFIHERVGESEVALFIVVAMVYVTLARGRLIGSSVMIHEAQYPRVFAIVKRACATLEIPIPLIFVREDYNVPVAALGFGEPYALVLSSHWIEHFEDDELAFIVGRQLGHIAAGHTRYLSLLSVNGNENPLIAVIFGAWLRSCDFTCDKVGLLVCGSLEAATRAIAVASFHHFGRQVNVQQFSEQGREIARDSVLKWGEWLGAEPYATRRIAHMEAFLQSPQYAAASAWFARDHAVEPPALPSPGQRHVERADCAGWWRRAAAVFIDLIIVGALFGAFSGQETSIVNVTTEKAAKHSVTSATRDTEASGQSDAVTGTAATQHNSPLKALLQRPEEIFRAGTSLWLAVLYMTLLVGLAGQTFGMMIAGLRVVTTDFRPPGIWRALWRYTIALFLWWLILPLSALTHRVMLHDRWSGTRLITAERVLARAFTPVA
jgi:uncharacterized RDD family membrane protein YckC/Zn-dependent protease with chaperone function